MITVLFWSPVVVSQRTACCGLSRLCESSRICRNSPASWESPGQPVEDWDQQQKPNFSAQPAHWLDASCSQLFSVSSLDLSAAYQPERGCKSEIKCHCIPFLTVYWMNGFNNHLYFSHLLRRERLEVRWVLGVGSSAGWAKPIALCPNFVPTKPTNLVILWHWRGLNHFFWHCIPDTHRSMDKSCSRRVQGTPYREDIPVPRHRWGWVQTSLHWDWNINITHQNVANKISLKWLHLGSWVMSQMFSRINFWSKSAASTISGSQLHQM